MHLAADLVAPQTEATVHEVARQWVVERIRVACARPPDFADYPDLSVRVRGAFGRTLAAMPARVVGGWSLPPAFSVLFAPAGRYASGLEIPKPMTIRAWTDQDRFIVELSLFGVAGVFADDAEVALVRCLENGVAINPESRHRVPLYVLESSQTKSDGVEFSLHPADAYLRFRSPLAVRSGGSLSADAEAILRSMVTRVSGMTRWQGLRLTVDWEGVRNAMKAITLDDADLFRVRWQRFSIRQGNTPIPMAGWLGSLRLSGRLAPLAAYLALGETCNTGSHAALGLGWYTLVMG